MYDSGQIRDQWKYRYVEWRVSREGDLDAIAGAVKNEGIWRLICDLMESAVQTGWEAANEAPPERETAGTGAG